MFIVEVLIVIGVLIAIGYPLLRPSPLQTAVVTEGDDYHKLLYARDAAFQALKDLEFDYKTQKLDEDDYQSLKKRYESEAVDIYRQIEAHDKGTPPPPKVAQTVQAKSEAAFCPECGCKAFPQDKFCRQCGRQLT